MQTNPLQPANGNAGNTGNAAEVISTSADKSETKDMFTRLLVAQIRNQDPLEPSDPTQFVNQLSQLSQTEALQSLSQTTSASASVLQSLQVLAMGGQVGSDVSVAAERMQVSEAPIRGKLSLATPGAPDIVLTGVDGRAHTVTLPFHGAGEVPFTLDPVKLGLAPGSYTVAARSSDGVAAGVQVTGRIDSVRVAAGGVVLQVAGVGDIDPASIISFNGKSGAALAAGI